MSLQSGTESGQRPVGNAVTGGKYNPSFCVYFSNSQHAWGLPGSALSEPRVLIKTKLFNKHSLSTYYVVGTGNAEVGKGDGSYLRWLTI